MAVVQEGAQLGGVLLCPEFQFSQQGAQWEGERGEFGIEKSDGCSVRNGVLSGRAVIISIGLSQNGKGALTYLRIADTFLYFLSE